MDADVIIVGAGPAGLACAITAAERGHYVQLFEASGEVGGQLNLARRIPGKEQEFAELVRYFNKRLINTGVQVQLERRVDAAFLETQGFDKIVIATHDVAEMLTTVQASPQTSQVFLSQWGVDPSIQFAGGLQTPVSESTKRSVVMLQRGTKKPGARLGKSTGWIHRTKLTKRGVTALSGCTYEKIDEQGVHYSTNGEPHLLAVDTIVLCAGQESEQDLANSLNGKISSLNLIGGARVATELDAMRAIDEGTRLAFTW